MDIKSAEIKINKIEQSRIGQLDQQDIRFGKLYADHMLVADYEDGAWKTPEIVPYGDLSLSPATTFIHYGQAIFEGVKAYRNPQGEVTIFRPDANWKRFNKSAHRMGMPDVPEEIFMEGLRQLLKLDEAWVPAAEGSALYIRPFMFATDEFIGVRPAEQFRFMIITSPSGAYYSQPVNIYVHDKYVRAFPGGIGETKAAGNYGASMFPMAEVRAMGYDQILWTDGFEHKYAQEIGTMNVFFVIGDKVITPDLEQGTILAGVTRDSIITLLRAKGITVEERAISLDEVEEAYKAGQLKEAFGSGTAASLAPIASLTYKEHKMVLPPMEEWTIANNVKKELDDIRYGRVADTHDWIFTV